jgi:peptidyl-prolyl cis-trans isomerase SurA
MQENNQTNDTPNSSPDVDVVPTNTTDTTTPAVNAPVVATYDSAPIASTVVTETTTTEVVTTNETPGSTMSDVTAVASSNARKQMFIQYGIATLVILIIGGGLVYALEQQGRIHTGIFDKITAVVNPAPAAAIVNGTKITKADYDKNLAQLQTAAEAQGADVKDASIQAEIKKQAIDVLVNTELLRQAAYAEGAMVTDDQVNARYEEIKSSIGGEEQLAAKMTELGITEPALRKDIEGEILIQGHLSKAVDTSKITVTEKELTDAYAQISSTATAGVTIPPLDEIKTQLEAQLKTNKEQELVNAYITKLREGASIEVLI